MTTKTPSLSIVTPVYACKDSIAELYERVKAVVSDLGLDFEIIFVVDGSGDKSWEAISELGLKDKRVKGILLSRNFGQHKAIVAGLEASTGEWVVVMDCDLQDQPEEISVLYQKACEGFDLVLGRRMKRKDAIHKRLFSVVFYRLLAYLTQTKQDPRIGNFGIYHRKVISAICKMGDQMKYFPAMIRWVGFHQTSVALEHAERKHGKTSYNFRRLFRLGLDVMLAFSDKPLRLTVRLGLLISVSSIVFAIVTLFRYLSGSIEMLGYTSLIISIWFFSGMIIFILGFVGLYIGKIFENVKKRPIYIITEEINF